MTRILIISRSSDLSPAEDFQAPPKKDQRPSLFQEGYEGPRTPPPPRPQTLWSQLCCMVRRMFSGAGGETSKDTRVAPMRIGSPEQVGDVARKLEASIRKSPYIGFEASKTLIRQWIDEHIAPAFAVDAGDTGQLGSVDPEILKKTAAYLQARAQDSEDGAIGRNFREAAQHYAAQLDRLADRL